MSNSCKKFWLRNAAGADKSDFAKNSDFASSKIGLYKLDIGKLETSLMIQLS